MNGHMVVLQLATAPLENPYSERHEQRAATTICVVHTLSSIRDQFIVSNGVFLGFTGGDTTPVSYTHLTLPTIYSV